MMEKGKNEFLGLLCNLYLVALLVALPLYTGQGYWQLGNTKYALFRNITLLCLGCWLVMGMPERLRMIAEAFMRWKVTGTKVSGKKTTVEKVAGAYGNTASVSGMDLAMAAYGVCVLVSAVSSSYGWLVWSGYEGWFMGAVSQLLFVGIYFFVSRQYGGAFWPFWLGEAALFLVTAFGLLHRLGLDPLGLQEGWNSGDWEYSHMLSTLGNINWLCGYYSVALAFLTVHYLLEKRRWLWLILYAAQVCAFVLLGIQGSQGGLLILAVCVGVSIWLGRHRAAVLQRICLLLTGFFAGMPLMWCLMRMRGEKAAIAADGNVFEYAEWYVWVIGAVVSFGIFVLLHGKEKYKSGKRKGNGARAGDKKWFVVFAAGCAVVGIVTVWYLFRHPLDDGFGSGRGFLWRIATESFMQADWKDKLLGAGPDCYGAAVFNRLGAGTEVWKDEHWEGAVFTNAHNEFLSQLCNVGILGTISYLAIFIVGLYGVVKPGKEVCRAGGTYTYYRWVVTLALIMYGMHSLVSFQQVLNTPLLFMVLGICEAERRRESEREGEN